MSGQDPLTFDDGKAPEAFRTIGEVAQAFGLRQHVLRYWEEQFPMLRPLKRAGGRRYYRPEDVRLVSEINRLLYHEGFTIRGARQALGGKTPVNSAPEPEAEPPREGEPLARPEIQGDIEQRLRRLRSQLEHALREA